MPGLAVGLDRRQHDLAVLVLADRRLQQAGGAALDGEGVGRSTSLTLRATSTMPSPCAGGCSPSGVPARTGRR